MNVKVVFCYDKIMPFKLITLTLITMVAFAANSVFCRLALVDPANDPISFTLVRLFSGALLLSFIFIKSAKIEPLILNKKTILMPLMLFAYALFFSLSYVQLGTGTGALILFSSVQLTMMFMAYLRGQPLNTPEKIGVLLAISGFVYLLLPGINMPPPVAASLMALSGISWGIYSLLGQGAINPILLTSRNFVLTMPMVIILVMIFPLNLTTDGYLWAALSGAITSALGYVLWYIILRDLITSTAAIVQLSVPAIAAFGGVVFLGEEIQTRLIIATIVIFSGIIIKVKSQII